MVENTLLSAVMYSPNLGDGVIAECISHTISKELEVESPLWLDIAGREKFGRPKIASGRAKLIHTIDTLPLLGQQLAMYFLLKPALELKLKQVWKNRLENVSGILIGGGQLLADTNLNFPLKLNALSKITNSKKQKISIIGVGVSSEWSSWGASLLTELFKGDLRFISVRDVISKVNLETHFKNNNVNVSVPINVYPDPGVLSKETFGACPAGKYKWQETKNTKTIGVSIIHPDTIKVHGGATIPLAEYVEKSEKLIDHCLGEGYEVVLHTNGAGEDEVALCEMRAWFENHTLFNKRLFVLERVNTPRDLAHAISSFDGLIAHRLHANIIAYSYSVPHVALSWDQKLSSFMQAVGRDAYLAEGDISDISDIIQKIALAMSDARINSLSPELETMKKRAKTGIIEAFQAIS